MIRLLPLENNKFHNIYQNKNKSLNDIVKDLNIVKKFSPNKRKILNFKGQEKEIGYIFGVLLGDGNIESRAISLAVKDLAFIKRFEEKAKKIGFINFTKGRQLGYLYRSKINSINLANFFKKINFKKLNKKQKIEFINGFFDSEGCVFCKKYDCYRGTYRKIACWNKNKNILISIQQFLKENNIKSYLSCRMMSGGHVIKKQYRKKYLLYELAIYKKTELKKFFKMFQFFGRKQKAMEILYASIR